MTTATRTDVIEFVLLHAGADDLDRIAQALRDRHKTLRTARAAVVAVGMDVTIKDISPKALVGLTGTVTETDGKHARVDLDAASTAKLRRSRTKYAARVPHDAVIFTMGGIPLSCCHPDLSV